jgi:5-methylcytosine-specific restriction endonuclease McrBC GTP-binding regulatory subunit McrB
MKIIITENKIGQLKIFVQEILDDELNNLRQMADEEWGLGEMDEIDEVESVEEIVVDDIKTTDGISVNVNLYLNRDREDFDNIIAMIEYTIEQWFPNAEIHIEKVYI